MSGSGSVPCRHPGTQLPPASGSSKWLPQLPWPSGPPWTLSPRPQQVRGESRGLMGRMFYGPGPSAVDFTSGHTVQGPEQAARRHLSAKEAGKWGLLELGWKAEPNPVNAHPLSAAQRLSNALTTGISEVRAVPTCAFVWISVNYSPEAKSSSARSCK